MYKKELNIFFLGLAAISSLMFTDTNCVSAAYMPVVLRECLANIYEVAAKGKNNNFDELYRMIKENRVVASEDLVIKSVRQALNKLQGDNRFDAQWKHEAAIYLEKYLETLDCRSVLCSLKGDNKSLRIMPHDLVMRALDADSTSKEIMYLSSQLTHIQNIELCGNTDFSRLAIHTKAITPTLPTDPGIMFNANTFTSMGSSVPNVVFGTGTTSPSINAWVMPVSSASQIPVNLQFSIPSDLKQKKAISLELHFLVTKQGFANGNIAARIKSLYTDNVFQFSVSEDMFFNNVIDSADLLIVEPALSDGLRHAYIDVPLQNSDAKKRDFAFISLSRVEPAGDEYDGDVFLVSAAFKYTRDQ